MARRGSERTGRTGQECSGEERRAVARTGVVRQSWRVRARCGLAGTGLARTGEAGGQRHGADCNARAGLGRDRPGRIAWDGRAVDWTGVAVTAGLALVRTGTDRTGSAGKAGSASIGLAWSGKDRPGRKGGFGNAVARIAAAGPPRTGVEGMGTAGLGAVGTTYTTSRDREYDAIQMA
jgi:hypothetical protein